MYMVVEMVVVVAFMVYLCHGHGQRSRASSYAAQPPAQPAPKEETELELKVVSDVQPVAMNNVEPPYVPQNEN